MRAPKLEGIDLTDNTPTVPSQAIPERTLNTFDATCIVVGAIVGVGIFFTPSKVAQLAGSEQLAVLAWALGGVIAICGALTFAQLGRWYHGSGAQYSILRDAYGPATGFLFVFCNAFAIQAGAIGIIAAICTSNLAACAGVSLTNLQSVSLSVLMIGIVTLSNVAGVRWGARVQNFTVLTKIFALLAIVTAAGVMGSSVSSTPVQSINATESVQGATSSTWMNWVGVMAGLVPAFFSYGGWQHALWISGEVKSPRTTLPRAIIGGVLIVVAVYMLSNWAYFRLLGYQGVVASRTLAADAASVIWREYGSRSVSAAVGISAFGVLNAQLLSGPRLLQQLAHDGRFFSVFSVPHQRLRTPWAAIMMLRVAGAGLLVLAGFDRIDRLLTGVVCIDGLFFVLTGIAVFVLARSKRMQPAGLGYPVIPILFIVGEICVVAGAYSVADTRAASLIGLGFVVAGVVVYGVFFARKKAMSS